MEILSTTELFFYSIYCLILNEQLAIAVLLNLGGTVKQDATMTCGKCKRPVNATAHIGMASSETHKAALAGSYIPQDRIVLALRLLIEGRSIRSTTRITNLDRNTIMKLLVAAGEKCEKLMGRLIVNIRVRDVARTKHSTSRNTRISNHLSQRRFQTPPANAS